LSRFATMESPVHEAVFRPGHHGDQINVLFVDGHVGTPTYPGDYPVSKPFIEVLESLDALRKK